MHRLLNTGYREVVDADLSDYFGQIPHAELMRSIARRVSDGRVLGWIKAWLEMAVEEDDGHGGRRRTNRARREHKGTPQGSPASPVLSNIYMRRFIVGWKVLGYARRFKAEMLTAVEALMRRLKLTVNTEKTHLPRQSLTLLHYYWRAFMQQEHPQVKKADLASRIADELNITKARAEDAVDAILDEVKLVLSEGEPVILRRFGTFQVRDKRPRLGRNPKTGEEADIPARRVVRFKAGKYFRDAVNDDG